MAKNKAFITGWPVKHSRSPLVHSYWLRRYGLEGDYVKRACEPKDFKDFLSSMGPSEYLGGNVTIPHKEAAYRHVDHCDETAEVLGAVNTVWLEGGVLHGTNTDGYGFLANLDDRAKGWDVQDRLQRGALVLGAGGASRPIIYGLLARGFKTVYIANRTISRAQELADKFGKSCEVIDLNNFSKEVHAVSLIINTTSIGMNDGQSPLSLAPFSKDSIVHDIVYTPLMTPFLQQAEGLGMVAVDGLGMLLHQAVPGFERWFGVRPEVSEELRQIILDDIGGTA